MENLDTLTATITSRYKFNPINVTYLKADTNYTFIYFKDGTKTVYAKTLALFEKNLRTFPNLKRINRSTIINADSIESHSNGKITLKSGEKIVVSRRRLKDFQNWWNNTNLY